MRGARDVDSSSRQRDASATRTAWMARGNCRNHPATLFFTSDGVGVDRARKICASCPVAEPCLEYALEHRIDHGVWGGASERERRCILKRRRLSTFSASSPFATPR